MAEATEDLINNRQEFYIYENTDRPSSGTAPNNCRRLQHAIS
jgi:hypothetical protein